MRIRLYGLLLLLFSAGAFYLLSELASPPTLAGPSIDQAVVSLFAVLTLLSGVSLLVMGPSLFEPIDQPPYRASRDMADDANRRRD
jgi:hypothetical protein